MFTGLIQHVGRVTALEDRPEGRRLVVDAAGWSHRPERGESIAVNGVCLTVVPDERGALAFDAVRETLERSTVGGLAEGSRVNLEHAARADTLMGGHTVQGHVDCTGRIDAFAKDGDWVRLGVAVGEDPDRAVRAIVPKGSVAVEGVSLTVASVEPAASRFEIALIPETLEKTTLGEARPGDPVNIETDIIARAVAYQLEHYFGAREPG